MKENNPEAVAERLGLKQIGNSAYYEKLYEHSGNTIVAYWEEGEFHEIIEYKPRGFLTLPVHIASLDAIYLSCIDGQRLINRNGIILSAPGDFVTINCYCREGDAVKKTALLNVTDVDGNSNVAIIRDMGGGEYKWGLLFSDGSKGFVSIDGNNSSKGNVFVKRGSDVLFLETLTRTKAYSYRVPLPVRGSPSIVLLQKNDDYNRQVHEYQVWEDGNFAWSFNTSRIINSARFLFWHPNIAHVKCMKGEGLIDLKNKEIILPFEYKNINVEEGDFAFMIAGNGARCLYDIAERKWVVAESDGWVQSKKRKQYRVFMGESERRAVFYYKERVLRG
jgi:hypothetical protein